MGALPNGHRHGGTIHLRAFGTRPCRLPRPTGALIGSEERDSAGGTFLRSHRDAKSRAIDLFPVRRHDVRRQGADRPAGPLSQLPGADGRPPADRRRGEGASRAPPPKSTTRRRPQHGIAMPTRRRRRNATLPRRGVRCATRRSKPAKTRSAARLRVPTAASRWPFIRRRRRWRRRRKRPNLSTRGVGWRAGATQAFGERGRRSLRVLPPPRCRTCRCGRWKQKSPSRRCLPGPSWRERSLFPSPWGAAVHFCAGGLGHVALRTRRRVAPFRHRDG